VPIDGRSEVEGRRGNKESSIHPAVMQQNIEIDVAEGE